MPRKPTTLADDSHEMQEEQPFYSCQAQNDESRLVAFSSFPQVRLTHDGAHERLYS